MVGDTQDDRQPASPGREKRAFTRNAIFLRAECTVPGQADRAIEILDFCPGGVFISFPSQELLHPIPARDDTIEIRCAVPMASGPQSLRFQGRVARADRAGAGIAFINPSFEALHILHEYAKNNPTESSSAGEAQGPAEEGYTGKTDSVVEHIVRSCGQIVEERLEPMARDFLEQAREQFFNLAGEVRNIAEKNAYYSALTTLNKDGSAFEDEFLRRMQNRLKEGPQMAGVSSKSELTTDDNGELKLSLIEEDVFEDWLAFTDMARAAELEYKQELDALERRLGVLFNRHVDKENNPYGPGAISQIFQESLATLALDRKIAAEGCKIFKKVLCERSGELYAELNRHLIEEGILPVLRAADKPRQPAPPSARPPVPDPLPQQAGSAAADSGVEQGAAPLQTVPGPTVSAGMAPPPVQPAAVMPPVANGDGPSAVAGAPPVPAASVAISQSSQDWYHLIQGLSNLQHHLVVSQQPSVQPAPSLLSVAPAETGNLPSAPSVQPAGPSQATVSPQPFTTDELLSALSRVRLEAPGTHPVENFHQDFMNKLQSALADAAPSTEPREVPSRETNILEFGGNLFDSVLTDQLVADTVKPWLNQLSIPLIKMALRDDSLFYDKSHLARQLINRIAELELFGDVSKVENAVRKKVDGLLEEMAGADEVTPELLQKMLKEVSLLVHVQNKAFEGNVRDLQTICEAEEQRSKSEQPSAKKTALNKLLAGFRPLVGEEAPAVENDTPQEYQQQARRLKIGSWLMLQRSEELKKRIRLAWVAKNLEKYVFVNVQGLREETLSQNELAHFLHKGEAVVLEDGNEQLVDRAQSSMLQKMHLQLLHETSHDQLTSLINRREFEKRLSETLARVRDSGMASMLCYLDLEQFNVVNNTFGYEGGDRALVEASRLLGQELGEKGVLARIGGDEFAMLFENCSLDDALQITSRQTTVFRDYRFVSGDKSLSLSFSAGLVAIDPDSESIEALLQAAEASCRIARSKGTNYVQVYHADEASLARHLNSVKWVSRIDEALDNDRLELRCQPIVSISGSSVAVHHSEVLLGVPDENGKLMSPVDFIMAAEHFRRMASVDRWVLEHAFRWMVDRADKLAELGGFAINLSGASLNEEGLIDFVIGLAEKLKVPMDKVCFEITETVGISHLSGASEFISELKKQTGCSFSLDDFGSGQSSYAYLKNLPVDYLKIDGAFVEKMDQNPYDFAVVKSITEIGHFMGKKIIAERVETEAVLKMLRQIGVDYAQGYYLGKPRNMKALGS